MCPDFRDTLYICIIKIFRKRSFLVDKIISFQLYKNIFQILEKLFFFISRGIYRIVKKIEYLEKKILLRNQLIQCVTIY